MWQTRDINTWLNTHWYSVNTRGTQDSLNVCEYTANTRAKCADTREYIANTPDTCISRVFELVLSVSRVYQLKYLDTCTTYYTCIWIVFSCTWNKYMCQEGRTRDTCIQKYVVTYQTCIKVSSEYMYLKRITRISNVFAFNIQIHCNTPQILKYIWDTHSHRIHFEYIQIHR